ncbi:unnamed protein product, partial [Boreogadus saida]
GGGMQKIKGEGGEIGKRYGNRKRNGRREGIFEMGRGDCKRRMSSGEEKRRIRREQRGAESMIGQGDEERRWQRSRKDIERMSQRKVLNALPRSLSVPLK